jgi:hypothetical protein
MRAGFSPLTLEKKVTAEPGGCQGRFPKTRRASKFLLRNFEALYTRQNPRKHVEMGLRGKISFWVETGYLKEEMLTHLLEEPPPPKAWR